MQVKYRFSGPGRYVTGKPGQMSGMTGKQGFW